MSEINIVHSDAPRATFTQALSEIYRREVPQYSTLLELVSEIKQRQSQSRSHDTQHRLKVEHHGAIRLGTAAELATICRLFAVLGMQPVGYYDLTVAGLPVHATCFRPLTQESLTINPFRVFTSVLRLELIQDQSLRAQAAEILSQRQIFTPRCLELIGEFEKSGQLVHSLNQRLKSSSRRPSRRFDGIRLPPWILLYILIRRLIKYRMLAIALLLSSLLS